MSESIEELFNAAVENAVANRSIVWEIADSIALCRDIEASISYYGYHVALAGGVLIHGSSTKDTDIIIYPHNSKPKKRRTFILKQLQSIGFIFPTRNRVRGSSNTPSKRIEPLRFGYDKKIVYCSEYKGKRVDLFFVK